MLNRLDKTQKSESLKMAQQNLTSQFTIRRVEITKEEDSAKTLLTSRNSENPNET